MGRVRARVLIWLVLLVALVLVPLSSGNVPGATRKGRERVKGGDTDKLVTLDEFSRDILDKHSAKKSSKAANGSGGGGNATESNDEDSDATAKVLIAPERATDSVATEASQAGVHKDVPIKTAEVVEGRPSSQGSPNAPATGADAVDAGPSSSSEVPFSARVASGDNDPSNTSPDATTPTEQHNQKGQPSSSVEGDNSEPHDRGNTPTTSNDAEEEGKSKETKEEEEIKGEAPVQQDMGETGGSIGESVATQRETTSDAAEEAGQIVIDDDDDDEGHHPDKRKDSSKKKPKKQVKFNYAAESAGAQLLAHSGNVQKAGSVLSSMPDTYMIAPCNEKRWFVIQLSEDITIDSIAMTNLEHYSSTFRDFQVLGSVKYPTDSWTVLGEFSGSPETVPQLFHVPEVTKSHWVRYLKVKMISHYGSEYYCTLTNIQVYGSTLLDSLREEMLSGMEEVQSVMETVNEARTAEEVVLTGGVGDVVVVQEKTIHGYVEGLDILPTGEETWFMRYNKSVYHPFACFVDNASVLSGNATRADVCNEVCCNAVPFSARKIPVNEVTVHVDVTAVEAAASSGDARERVEERTGRESGASENGQAKDEAEEVETTANEPDAGAEIATKKPEEAEIAIDKADPSSAKKPEESEQLVDGGKDKGEVGHEAPANELPIGGEPPVASSEDVTITIPTNVPETPVASSLGDAAASLPSAVLPATVLPAAVLPAAVVPADVPTSMSTEERNAVIASVLANSKAVSQGSQNIFKSLGQRLQAVEIAQALTKEYVERVVSAELNSLKASVKDLTFFASSAESRRLMSLAMLSEAVASDYKLDENGVVLPDDAEIDVEIAYYREWLRLHAGRMGDRENPRAMASLTYEQYMHEELVALRRYVRNQDAMLVVLCIALVVLAGALWLRNSNHGGTHEADAGSQNSEHEEEDFSSSE